jgi:hypothetical protein
MPYGKVPASERTADTRYVHGVKYTFPAIPCAIVSGGYRNRMRATMAAAETAGKGDPF